MRYLRNYSAHRRCIRPLNRLVEFGHAQALDNLFLLGGITDHTAVILDLDLSACFFF